MRRILIGVTLATIALAAAIILSWPGQQSVFRTPGILGAITIESQLNPPEIDAEISAMNCRIVAKERLDGDRFLLTEECAWNGGRVERRRFLAFRKGD